MIPKKMFVYGILQGYKSEATKAYILNKEKYIVNGYPTIRRKRNSIVEGEIFDINESELRVFDQIEGVNAGFYKRYITIAYTFKGVKDYVWIYKQIEREVEMTKKEKMYDLGFLGKWSYTTLKAQASKNWHGGFEVEFIEEKLKETFEPYNKKVKRITLSELYCDLEFYKSLKKVKDEYRCIMEEIEREEVNKKRKCYV